MNGKKVKNAAWGIIRFLFLGFMVLISVGPLIWIVMSSFKTNREILSSAFSLPTSFSFAGYQAALDLWSWLLYTGMIIILVLAGILSIPEDVVEAAKIDGANEMQINFKIRLPLVRTIIGTSEILAATSMLREFELIYLTTNGGPGDLTLNLPLYLYKTSMTDNNYGYANMMGVVLIVAGVIVVYAINRLFRMNEADY